MKFQRTNTKIPLLDDFYQHFDEDNRLKTRHGYVEYYTNMHYIEKYLDNDLSKSILDIGAGTGAYSIPLSNKGYSVTSVELVKHNIDQIKEKSNKINCIHANAIDLSMLQDNSFDIVLLFGPMYHLMNNEDRIKALSEAKRVLKKDGYLFISYYMNDYAVISYGFIKQNIIDEMKRNAIDDNFIIHSKEEDIFSFSTLDDINNYNKELSLNRELILSSDGASDYLRVELNKLTEEEFKLFIKYHLLNCERYDLLGASSHLLDIVRK